VRTIIKENLNKKPPKEQDFIMPSSTDVDDESWLNLNGDETNFSRICASQSNEQDAFSRKDEKSLDKVLHSFKSFVGGESDIAGVVTLKKGIGKTSTNKKLEIDEQLDIDPKLFLNLFHKAMITTLGDIQNLTTEEEDDIHLYFDTEDFSNKDGDNIYHNGDSEIRDMMQAMEFKLNRKCNAKNVNDYGKIWNQNQQDAAVLSGLIESIDASEGAPGPVRNILSELKSSNS